MKSCMLREEELEAVRSRLRSVNWAVYWYNKYLNRGQVHEQIQFQIMLEGMAQGYFSVTEIPADPDSDKNKRIDNAWMDYDEWKPVALFEVDGSAKMNSIEKLQGYPLEGVEKTIVSKSNNQTYAAEKGAERTPEGINHIDAQVWSDLR